MRERERGGGERKREGERERESEREGGGGESLHKSNVSKKLVHYIIQLILSVYIFEQYYINLSK